MTIAVCFHCGSLKNGSFVLCPSCNTRPTEDKDCIYSMLMSTHYLKEELLIQMGKDIKKGNYPNVDSETWTKMSVEFQKFKTTPTGKMMFSSKSNDGSQRELLIKDFNYILERLKDTNKEIRYSLKSCLGVFQDFLNETFGSVEGFKKQDKKIKIEYLQKIKNAEKEFEKEKNFPFQVSSSIFSMIVCSYVESDKVMEDLFNSKLSVFFTGINLDNENNEVNVKSIISCPRCGEKYKVPLGKTLEISCKKCNHVWVIKT